MYYLEEFCRICIKTGVKLVDINTPDFDRVTFGEKLEICTKMVINSESLSTQICVQCVKKLRTSYEFQKMCKQSTTILQGYLTELLSSTHKITPETFVNSELRVSITPLYKNINVKHNTKVFAKKRITKEQRCSLLKQLLSKKSRPNNHKFRARHLMKRKKARGGLRGILDFTKNYDFGYKLDANHNTCNISEPTPLSRLTDFTNTFFLNNFAEFRNTILYIIENKDSLSESDDDDDMFESHSPDNSQLLDECEELVVEPDIKIKTEIDIEDNDPFYSCNYYVETSYSDNECKKENEDPPEEPPSPLFSQAPVQMLDELVGNLGNRKPFSHHSVRCRTRGNPYISPELRAQFLYKSFQCEKCNRYFKSPGYLKAHISKIHS